MIYVNARFLSQPGTGVQRFAYQISRALRALRDDVRFLCPEPAAQGPLARTLGAVGVAGGSGQAWEQFALPRHLRRAGDCRLLLNLGNTAPLAPGVPQVATLHDVSYRRFPQSYSLRFRLAYAVIVRRMLRTSAALLTVSEFSRREIAACYGYPAERIHVIGNAVDARFVPGAAHPEVPEDGSHPYLLAVSSPVFHKNFHRLVEAYAAWPLSERIDLRIIGGQAASFSRQAYARAPGVTFAGRVSDEALIALYQRARAFVFPSLYEGFGIPPLEAQACGCPVIASRAASMPEVLGTSALYFDPADTQDLCRAMTRVCTDEAMRAELAARGLVNVHRYAWETLARRVSDVVDTVTA